MNKRGALKPLNPLSISSKIKIYINFFGRTGKRQNQNRKTLFKQTTINITKYSIRRIFRSIFDEVQIKKAGDNAIRKSLIAKFRDNCRINYSRWQRM